MCYPWTVYCNTTVHQWACWPHVGLVGSLQNRLLVDGAHELVLFQLIYTWPVQNRPTLYQPFSGPTSSTCDMICESHVPNILTHVFSTVCQTLQGAPWLLCHDANSLSCLWIAISAQFTSWGRMACNLQLIRWILKTKHHMCMCTSVDKCASPILT